MSDNAHFVPLQVMPNFMHQFKLLRVTIVAGPGDMIRASVTGIVEGEQFEPVV